MLRHGSKCFININSLIPITTPWGRHYYHHFISERNEDRAGKWHTQGHSGSTATVLWLGVLKKIYKIGVSFYLDHFSQNSLINYNLFFFLISILIFKTFNRLDGMHISKNLQVAITKQPKISACVI